MIPRLTGKEKLILTIVAWTAAVVGLVMGVLLPLYLRLQNFPALYADAEQQAQELEGTIAKFKDVKTEYEAITERVPLIAAQFLEPKNGIVFIESLEDLAKETGLYKEIQLVSEPNAVAEEKAKASFVFQMTVVGPYERVMDFLARVENFSYATDVERMHMVPVKTSQAYGQAAEPGREPFKAAAGDIAASFILRVHAATP